MTQKQYSENIERLKQLAVESILDNESLTDNLTDKSAQVLIDWGVAQVDIIIEELQRRNMTETEMGGRIFDEVGIVLRTMREVNRFLPKVYDLSEVRLVEGILGLIKRVSSLPPEEYVKSTSDVPSEDSYITAV